MQNITLDVVIERIDQLEKVMIELKEQLSVLVEENVSIVSKQGIGERDPDISKNAFEEVYKKMGISPDFELRPLKELRESMREHGIRAEDNEFSRGIIDEREK